MSLDARLPNEPDVAILISERSSGGLIECLDDGFVRLVDHMGSDAAIVQAARVSYGAGTKSVRSDRALIRYLMSHRHTTPFEMCEIKFHIRMPMDAHRQQVRHRTASLNEYSTRYSEAIDSCQTTKPEEWRSQSRDNKQGSDGGVTGWPEGERKDELQWTSPGEYLSHRERQLQNHAREVYEQRLRFGVAREQARKDLPLSTMTEYYWKMDLHNLFHYLALRMDSHAQLEIRTYANAIFRLIEPLFPAACEAFKDYRLDSMFLSGPDLAAIRWIIQGAGIQDAGEQAGLSERETVALPTKLGRLGVIQG